MILLNPFFGTLLRFFFLSRHGWKHWLTRVTATVISLLIISYINFLTLFRLFSVPVTRKWQMPESTHCKEMPLSFKLLLLQLGFKCSAAADKLRFILLGSQCLRTLNQAFPFFFFLIVFTSECAEICRYIEKCPFLVLFGATDGNFMEKCSVTPSW